MSVLNWAMGLNSDLIIKIVKIIDDNWGQIDQLYTRNREATHVTTD